MFFNSFSLVILKRIMASRFVRGNGKRRDRRESERDDKEVS